jgi:hypothetical protein
MTKDKKKHVWITTITHRHGIDVKVNQTKQGAIKVLADFVDENAESEDVDISACKSPSSKVDKYFAEMQGNDEFYEMSREELGD